MKALGGPQMLAGTIGDISIYGQELNYTTWRLSKMNLAIRGIDGRLLRATPSTTTASPTSRADTILANPPFNVSDWRGDPDAIHATSNGHYRGLGNMRGETK